MPLILQIQRNKSENYDEDIHSKLEVATLELR